MSTEQGDNKNWFARYRDGQKLIVNREIGTVTATNPVLIATASELLTLLLVKNGFDYQYIASLFGYSKSGVTNQMSKLRKENHAEGGKLFRKAKTLGLDNPLAIRGLSLRIVNPKKRDFMLKKIAAATEALNGKLLNRIGRRPFGVFPPEELDITRNESWRSQLRNQLLKSESSEEIK